MQESIASVRTIFKGSGSQKLLTCKTQSYLNLLMKNRTKANKQIRSYEEFNNVCEITFFLIASCSSDGQASEPKFKLENLTSP